MSFQHADDGAFIAFWLQDSSALLDSVVGSVFTGAGNSHQMSIFSLVCGSLVHHITCEGIGEHVVLHDIPGCRFLCNFFRLRCRFTISPESMAYSVVHGHSTILDSLYSSTSSSRRNSKFAAD